MIVFYVPYKILNVHHTIEFRFLKPIRSKNSTSIFFITTITTVIFFREIKISIIYIQKLKPFSIGHNMGTSSILKFIYTSTIFIPPSIFSINSILLTIPVIGYTSFGFNISKEWINKFYEN